MFPEIPESMCEGCAFMTPGFAPVIDSELLSRIENRIAQGSGS